jgi:hypothetical protein
MTTRKRREDEKMNDENQTQQQQQQQKLRGKGRLHYGHATLMPGHTTQPAVG